MSATNLVVYGIEKGFGREERHHRHLTPSSHGNGDNMQRDSWSFWRRFESALTPVRGQPDEVISVYRH
jgi:hypothetical protein